ncbi:MAG: hypothetical protein K940chlam3_01112 [Chlamydiae bacterium]|nr:hypothetical protein [Chlamydiota bacterium]
MTPLDSSLLLYQNALPVELHINIDLHLDGPSLYAASRVNKIWHCIFQNDIIWESICKRFGFHKKDKDTSWKETIQPTYKLRHSVKVALNVIIKVSEIHGHLELLMGLRDSWNCICAFGFPRKFTHLGTRPKDYYQLSQEIHTGLHHIMKELDSVVANYEKFRATTKTNFHQLLDDIHNSYYEIMDILSLSYAPFEGEGEPTDILRQKIEKAINLNQTLIDNFTVPIINFLSLGKILEPHFSNAYQLSKEEASSTSFPYGDFISLYNNHLVLRDQSFTVQYHFNNDDRTKICKWFNKFVIMFTQQKNETLIIKDRFRHFFDSSGEFPFPFKFYPHGNSLLKFSKFLDDKYMRSHKEEDVFFYA